MLDEPTIGLHAVDTRRLLAILRRLADRGNTVVVVEHDPEAIEAADHVIDLGSGRGQSAAASVLFAGNAARARAGRRARRRASCCAAAGAPEAGGRSRKRSATGDRRSRRRVVPFRRAEGALTIVGARAAQPAEPDRARAARTPRRSGRRVRLGQVDARAGHPAQRLRPAGQGARPSSRSGSTTASTASSAISDLLLVDQSPLGRSARSNPVTYTKAWDEIRQAVRPLGAVPSSRGVTARDFSFNSVGRPLRGLPRDGLADHRHAVPGRRDGALRRLRRPAIPGPRARACACAARTSTTCST